MAEAKKRTAKARVTRVPELLPCPFCGKAPKIVRVTVGAFTTWEIRCACTRRDDAWVQFAFETEAQALTFWQVRGSA